VRLALAVRLSTTAERLPAPGASDWGVPSVTVDARAASAVQRVALALDCATGRVAQFRGAFAA
jgi:hypothetical protein